MMIKKFSFLSLILGFLASVSLFPMHDSMEIVTDACGGNNLAIVHARILDALKTQKPLHEITVHVDDFIDTYAQKASDKDLSVTVYIHYFLRVAAQLNRVDVLGYYSDYFHFPLPDEQALPYEQHIKDKRKFLESLVIGSCLYGAADACKYVTSKMIELVDHMPLYKRVRYEFDYNDDFKEIYLNPLGLLDVQYYATGPNKDLNTWATIFDDYWHATHLFSTKYMPDLKQQIASVRSEFTSTHVVSKYGRPVKFKYLDDQAQGFFEGTYYTKALMNVCSWYQRADDDLKKTIKECAQICQHKEICKALTMLDNPMKYIFTRDLGYK